jgi:hypothetical protein
MPVRPALDQNDPANVPLVQFTHAFKTVRVLVFTLILVFPVVLAIGGALLVQNIRGQAKTAYISACHDVNDTKTQIVGLLDEGIKRAQLNLNGLIKSNAPQVQIDTAIENLKKATASRDFVDRKLVRKDCSHYPPPPSPNTKSNSKPVTTTTTRPTPAATKP